MYAILIACTVRLKRKQTEAKVQSLTCPPNSQGRTASAIFESIVCLICTRRAKAEGQDEDEMPDIHPGEQRQQPFLPRGDVEMQPKKREGELWTREI